MENISMAGNQGKPFICAQVKTKDYAQGQYRQETLNHPEETEIRCIENQVTGMIIRSQFGGKTTAQTPAVNNQMIFRVLLFQPVIYKLHIIQHFLFTPGPGTFAKPPVIHQHHIIIIPVKIFGITRPSLYTAAVAVKIQYQSAGILPVKMEPVDPYARLYIKKILPEGNIIPEQEVLLQFLRFEDEYFLEKISQQGKCGDSAGDIPDEEWQG